MCVCVCVCVYVCVCVCVCQQAADSCCQTALIASARKVQPITARLPSSCTDIFMFEFKCFRTVKTNSTGQFSPLKKWMLSLSDGHWLVWCGTPHPSFHPGVLFLKGKIYFVPFHPCPPHPSRFSCIHLFFLPPTQYSATPLLSSCCRRTAWTQTDAKTKDLYMILMGLIWWLLTERHPRCCSFIGAICFTLWVLYDRLHWF